MRLPLEHFQTLSEGRLDFKQDPRPDKGDKALDPFRNEKLGGSKNSFHCTTIAVMTLIYKVSISLFVAYHDIAWGHSPKMASWNPGVGIRRCWNPKMLGSSRDVFVWNSFLMLEMLHVLKHDAGTGWYYCKMVHTLGMGELLSL